MCTNPIINLVVVEGGAKAIRRFSKLMMRRIDWDTRVHDEKVVCVCLCVCVCVCYYIHKMEPIGFVCVCVCVHK